MIKHIKAKAALAAGLTIGTGIIGVAAFPGVAQASDVWITVDGNSGQAYSLGANGAVKVCDTYRDGDAVYTKYERVSGTSGRLEERNGFDTCRSTGNYPGDPIYKFDVCIDRPFAPDICSSYHYTGR